jgi:outer membrane receptor protein involved in Fe transport
MSFNMSAKWKWRSEVAFLSLAATSMLALTCPEPALAQTGAAAGDEPESTDIVVTAQRSEERLQDVPISISVLSGDALEQSRAQGLTEVLRTVPGVAAPIGALGQPVLTIRGVTASSLAFAGASTAGVYFDSAPYGFVRSALAPDADIYDLSRIEVLRGPQGTLFGANAVKGPHGQYSTLVKSKQSVKSVSTRRRRWPADLALNPFGFELELGASPDVRSNYASDQA